MLVIVPERKGCFVLLSYLSCYLQFIILILSHRRYLSFTTLLLQPSSHSIFSFVPLFYPTAAAPKKAAAAPKAAKAAPKVHLSASLR